MNREDRQEWASDQEQRELVQLNYEARTLSPLTEVPDEVLRTSHKDEQERGLAPQWLDVEDELIDDVMSVDEAEY